MDEYRCAYLHDVRLHHTLSISWIKAHTGASTPDALGNATADWRPADAQAPQVSSLAQTSLSVTLEARAHSPPPWTPYAARNDEGEPPPGAGTLVALHTRLFLRPIA